MIVLQEIGTAQTLKVIPRSYTADSMVITEEGTGVDTTYAITPTRVNYNDALDSEGTYMSISKIVTLVEDTFYDISILNGTDEVYRGRIFCTNQTPSDYSINNGEYIEPTQTDNDFIVI